MPKKRDSYKVKQAQEKLTLAEYEQRSWRASVKDHQQEFKGRLTALRATGKALARSERRLLKAEQRVKTLEERLKCLTATKS